MNNLWLRNMIIGLSQTCLHRAFMHCPCSLFHLGRIEFENFAYSINYSTLWDFLPV